MEMLSVYIVCSAGKKNCNMSITTDREDLAVAKIRNEHTLSSRQTTWFWVGFFVLNATFKNI
jgi:hypothetical protein